MRILSRMCSQASRMTQCTTVRTFASNCARFQSLALGFLPQHFHSVAAPGDRGCFCRIKADAYLHSEMVTGLAAAKFSRPATTSRSWRGFFALK